AAVASPPSPLKPAIPLPATVAMMPVADTWRTEFVSTAEKTKPPPGRRATERGSASWALVAAPSSPPELAGAGGSVHVVPSPATGMRYPRPAVSDVVRGIVRRAALAGPPSPHGAVVGVHGIPVPAQVAMTPSSDPETLRMRWSYRSATR